MSEAGRALADSREFDFEGVASASEAAEVLHRLAQGIRARSPSLSLGDEEIGVFPDGELSLEVTEGLKGGETLITGPFKSLRTLKPGDAVKKEEKKKDGDGPKAS